MGLVGGLMILLTSKYTGSINLQTSDDVNYFLGENLALIEFDALASDSPEDIKNAINTALDNYDYYVYNGRSLTKASDITSKLSASSTVVWWDPF